MSLLSTSDTAEKLCNLEMYLTFFFFWLASGTELIFFKISEIPTNIKKIYLATAWNMVYKII